MLEFYSPFQTMYKVNPETGLGTFPELAAQGVANFVTHDCKIWGNRQAMWAKDLEEKKFIADKDQEIAKLLGAKLILTLTTPIEPTLLNYDSATHQTILKSIVKEKGDIPSTLIRANAIIMRVPEIEVEITPGDCAVILVVHPQFNGFIMAHVGCPQTIQGLLTSTINLWLSQETGLDSSRAEIFITSYICKEHFVHESQTFPNFEMHHAPLKDFLTEDKQNGKMHCDFMGFIKKQLNSEFGITKIYETGLCPYEEAEKGNLFSHTRTKQDSEKYPEGRFSVSASLKL